MVRCVLPVCTTRRSKGQSCNEYFDMDLQCAVDKTQQFRIMFFKDYPITYESYFIKASQLLKLKNMATAQSGKSFKIVLLIFKNQHHANYVFWKRKLTKMKKKDKIIIINWGKLIWQNEGSLLELCLQSVRVANVSDRMTSIAALNWESNFDKIEESNFYFMAILNIRNFNSTQSSPPCYTDLSRVSKLVEKFVARLCLMGL